VSTLTYLIHIDLGQSAYEPEEVDEAVLNGVGGLIEDLDALETGGVTVSRVGESREDFGGKPLVLAEHDFTEAGDGDE
jgi:hypothetical protein